MQNTTQAAPIAEPFVTKRAVAEHLAMTPRDVDGWMKDGSIPFYKVGSKSVRFRLSEVEAALLARINATSAA
jgi:excisionase family DNA binding protein